MLLNFVMKLQNTNKHDFERVEEIMSRMIKEKKIGKSLQELKKYDLVEKEVEK